ncbi:MAG: peptidylprolyl isomerase [Opitutae bacterium]|nr:peptidylprolyl isomerase [Opitutae bacterium]
MPAMKRWIGFVLACAGLLGSAAAQTDGIFADFSTSMGDFTVFLDHERAPRAVASFVGLATGKTGWLDEHTNVWHRPFYDGSIFHRVVKVVETNNLVVETNGIAIQGGGYLWRSVSTNTGVVYTNFAGPGYKMLECLTNGLAHSNGAISMANSGPNTDGSQFFITATNVPFWDGGYSVFGHVVSGLPVVVAIAAVAVQGPNDRPVEDVVLSRVAIRREGAAAAAFDVAAQGIPSPESTPMAAYRSGTNLELRIELATQTKPLMFSESPDLQNWEHSRLLPASVNFYTDPDQIIPGSIPLANLGAKYFFHSSRVRYPTPLTAPASQRGRTFTFKWDNPDLTYSATFSSNFLVPGTGWVQEGTNAPVPRQIFVGDGWIREAYMGRLYFMDDLAREYSYDLGFNPGQATNRFTGDWGPYNSPVRYPMSGTFTWQ